MKLIRHTDDRRRHPRRAIEYWLVIELNRPIKTAGIHDVTISLYREIKTVVKLQVGDVVEEAPEVPAEAEEVVEVEETVEAAAEEDAE